MKITLKDTKTGQILKLTKVDEFTYFDEVSGETLVDTWNEIELMVELYKTKKETNFFDCHFFLTMDKLVFFKEVDLIKLVSTD